MLIPTCGDVKVQGPAGLIEQRCMMLGGGAKGGTLRCGSRLDEVDRWCAVGWARSAHGKLAVGFWEAGGEGERETARRGVMGEGKSDLGGGGVIWGFRGWRARPAAGVPWAFGSVSLPGACGLPAKPGSRGIEGLGLADDLAPEVTRQVLRRQKIYLPAEHFAQLHEHAADVEEAHAGAGGELDQHVDVAGGAESVAAFGSRLAQDAAEDAELLDAVAAAEVRDLVVGKINAVDFHVV